MKICNECETVAHCTKHGCIPKVSAKDAIKLALGHDAMRSALNALEARCGTNAEERGPTGAITLLNTALAEQPAPVQGWKLVPVEPTREIEDAIAKARTLKASEIWGDAIAAAPQPAQQEPVNQRAYEMALRQWESWKTYALELQEKLVKYEGGTPMVLNTSPQPPEQRKPLTDEEMYLAIRPLFRTDAFANAALKISKDEYQAIEAAIRARGSNT